MALTANATPAIAISSIGLEKTRFIGVPHEAMNEHQHRGDQQRDLDRRAHGERQHQSHLTLAREVDRGQVLRGIADDREHHHAEEESRHAERGRRGLKRARHELGHQRDRGGRADQHPSDFHSGHARRAHVGVLVERENVAMGDQRVDDIGEVHDDQHDRHAEAQPLVEARALAAVVQSRAR